MRRVAPFAAALVAALLVLGTVPAGAISYGESDGTAHPNVGALVIALPDGPRAICSGTLVAPKVFLTAAHCVFGDLGTLPLGVTFDPVVTPARRRSVPLAPGRVAARVDEPGHGERGDVLR